MAQPPDAIDVAFTVGAEAGDVINVACSLKKYGVKVDQRHLVHYWLSSDATGDTLAADPGTTAIGTDGTILVEATDDLVGIALTEADGDIDFNVTHAAGDNFYLNLALPGGRVVTSPVIDFAA